jgi:DNA-binding transcriptional LysR family regulator
VTQLEADLGVRLLQRSTRKFAVTDVGQSVYRHAQSMLNEAQAVREAVEQVSVEPRGVVKVSAPAALAQHLLAQLLPEFLRSHPKVRLQLHVSNRRVDVINEGFDLALRVRSDLRDDGDLVMRRFGEIREMLVASPNYLARVGRPTQPTDLEAHTTLSMSEEDSRQRWILQGPDGATEKIDIHPVLMALDFPLLLAAAEDGLGIALLPEMACADAVRNGELEVVLPEWHLPMGICHGVFPSRRGVLPAVRALIEFLAERLPPLIQANRLQCSDIVRGRRHASESPKAAKAS